MTVTDSLPKKKLKNKFSSKKIEVEPRSEACDISHQLWMNDECGHSISLNGNEKSTMKKSHNFVRQTLDNPKLYAADNLKVRSPVQRSCKRGLTGILDFQEQKRRKMDCSVKQQLMPLELPLQFLELSSTRRQNSKKFMVKGVKNRREQDGEAN